MNKQRCFINCIVTNTLWTARLLCRNPYTLNSPCSCDHYSYFSAQRPSSNKPWPCENCSIYSVHNKILQVLGKQCSYGSANKGACESACNHIGLFEYPVCAYVA